MCGICGVFHTASEDPPTLELLERMTHVIAHRGPDERGIRLDGPVGLGSTRLSIIDLGGGHQPMPNEADDVWVVFNGEIWNYQRLRTQLEEQGHRFRTRCDTETIVHAYEEYGLDCPAHLHGMFAFALWDAPRRRLLLARDRAGKKPLYYTVVDGNLAFASEIKALLCHPRVKRQVDAQALADYLTIGYVPGPATLFANIFTVQPGHWLLFEEGRMREQCYWDFTFTPTEEHPIEEYAAGIRHHVRRAVEERMMADVPVGALLSGGVDSSIVTGTMSQLTSQRVKTFAVGFDVPGYSELPYAKLVADHFGAEHHELVVRSADMSRYWPLLTWHRDQPVSEPSDLGMYLIATLARQHVKVVLTGEGGDELFAGYPKYVVDGIARYYRLLPDSVRDQVIMPFLDHLPYRLRKLKSAARALSQPAPQRWTSWFGVFYGPLKDELLSAGFKARIDSDSSRLYRRWLEKHPPCDDLSAMLYLDTKIWLPDNLLMKSDKMTMAASLEARVPLLDSQLIEYAASIPSHAKVRPFKAKYLFKHAFEDFLPQTILTRKKMGFNVPTGTWFREGQRDILSRLLLSDRARSRGHLNPACVARLLRDHVAGRTNYQRQLFILASLEVWFRVFIDSSSLEYPCASVEDLLEPRDRRATVLAAAVSE